MGWCLHYFPFFIMQRQLFLHHYFPALYFSILTLCGVWDFVTSPLRPRVQFYLVVLFTASAIMTFAYFSPLAYGGQWTKAKCESAKWLKTWDFSWYVQRTPTCQPGLICECVLQ